MPAHRKPLPRRVLSAQDRQFENLLRRAADYQKTHRRSSIPKPARRVQRRRRAA